MSNYVFAPPPPTEAENNVFATWENGFSKEELDRISADNLTFFEPSKNFKIEV